MAGLHLQLFAGRNRGRIAGLVFVDAVTAELSADPLIRHGWINYARAAEVVAWLAARGLLRPLRRTGDHIGLTSEAIPTKHWAFTDAAHGSRASADEIAVWEDDGRAGQGRRPARSRLAHRGGRGGGWPAASWPPAPTLTAPGGHGRSPSGYHETVAQARHASLPGVRFADAVVRAIVHVNEAATNSA